MDETNLPRRRPWIGWRLVASSRPGEARGFLRLWPWWERFSLWLARAEPVSERGLLLLGFKKYKGDARRLPDGTTVQPGDLVGELHFDNRVLIHLTHGNKLNLLRAFREELIAVAGWIVQGKVPRELQALYGVTLLARGTVPLGFMRHPYKQSWRTSFELFFMHGLLVLYSPDGLLRLERGAGEEKPEEVWMSRTYLMKRYGRPE